MTEIFSPEVSLFFKDIGAVAMSVQSPSFSQMLQNSREVRVDFLLTVDRIGSMITRLDISLMPDEERAAYYQALQVYQSIEEKIRKCVQEAMAGAIGNRS